MKTDLYTKILLTVIALVLTLNLVKDLDWITTAKADNSASIANIAAPKTDGVIDVNLVSIDGRTVGSQNLPVVIRGISMPYSSSMPVTIKDIDTYSSLNVNIKDSKTLDVHVKNTSDFPR